MKAILLLSLLALGLCSYYDMRDHKSGHELEYSLRGEKDIIFVVFWMSSDEDPQVQEYNNGNRTKIREIVEGNPQVSFSVVDMAIDGHDPGEEEPDIAHDYSVLYESMNGEPFADVRELLKTEGPIVNVMRKEKGVKITGAGIAGEVEDQIEEIAEKIEEEKEKEAEKEAEEEENADDDKDDDEEGDDVDENDIVPDEEAIDDIY